MLYLMVQKYKLCAVHCVNTVLQGPFFSEFTLAALASYLDTKERQMMFQGTPPPPVAISSLRIPTMSPRRRFQYPGSSFSLSFSVAQIGVDNDKQARSIPKSWEHGFRLYHLGQLALGCTYVVLQKALEVWDYHNNPLNCPLAEPAQIDPELENAFICHLHDHWFCIRKVNGEW
ncbi:hypothetical protein GOBAR_AA02160 [Gossypium barbadense]|uniref:ubiquitinyl hydrolase 1 n=1 Tax=Gossypium barbadense TaxID=3634 RepID=A0A2P5YS33_GOSBA|nr:hypothetical protein GOBAR_AA02160 [Gossypium barbadense]